MVRLASLAKVLGSSFYRTEIVQPVARRICSYGCRAGIGCVAILKTNKSDFLAGLTLWVYAIIMDRILLLKFVDTMVLSRFRAWWYTSSRESWSS